MSRSGDEASEEGSIAVLSRSKVCRHWGPLSSARYSEPLWTGNMRGAEKGGEVFGAVNSRVVRGFV